MRDAFPSPSDRQTAETLMSALRACGGRLVVELRRSPYTTLLDASDPRRPVLMLHPDEAPARVLAEGIEHCRSLGHDDTDVAATGTDGCASAQEYAARRGLALVRSVDDRWNQ